MALTKRKCFISYHHADQNEVNEFIRIFDHALDCFTARGLGEEMSKDIIDSTDTDYVMSRIRALYLKGSSVTLLMIGRHTWSRRYVDWETQASLRQDRDVVPNGLLGIKLPSYNGGTFPERFTMNLMTDAAKKANQPDCYARHMTYPASVVALESAIEAAHQRRTTHAHLIVNPRERFKNNKTVVTAI
jgi:hypothetical protein